MASRKIVSGKYEGVFEGDASITRGEFSAILVRALGLPSNGESRFDNVLSTDWFYGAVGTASEYGVVNGKGDGKFEPNGNVTRQEAMVMIQRAAMLTEFSSDNVSVQGFTDLEQVSAWALETVNFNVANGLIVGSNGVLRPNDTITRTECATVVLRLLQKAQMVDVRTQA